NRPEHARRVFGPQQRKIMFRSLLFSFISSTMFLAAATQPAQIRRPLVFEPNRGQAPASVKWLARGSGYDFFLTDGGLSFVLPEMTAGGEVKYTTVRMKLEGSRTWNKVSGHDPTGGVSNYVRGSDFKDALTAIPHYGRLTVAGVYEGIDLVFYSH